MEEKCSNPVNYTEHPLYIAVKLHLADTHKHAVVWKGFRSLVIIKSLILACLPRFGDKTMNFLYSLAPLKKGQEWKNNLGGGGRSEKQMPKCSSSVDRCWRWLTCLLIKSWWFRRLNQGYYEKATQSAKIASKRWRSLVRNPQWVSRSCWHRWVNAFFFLFSSLFFHLKLKCGILASKTCEM